MNQTRLSSIESQPKKVVVGVVIVVVSLVVVVGGGGVVAKLSSVPVPVKSNLN